MQTALERFAPAERQEDFPDDGSGPQRRYVDTIDIIAVDNRA